MCWCDTRSQLRDFAPWRTSSVFISGVWPFAIVVAAFRSEIAIGMLLVTMSHKVGVDEVNAF